MKGPLPRLNTQLEKHHTWFDMGDQNVRRQPPNKLAFQPVFFELFEICPKRLTMSKRGPTPPPQSPEALDLALGGSAGRSAHSLGGVSAMASELRTLGPFLASVCVLQVDSILAISESSCIALGTSQPESIRDLNPK